MKTKLTLFSASVLLGLLGVFIGVPWREGSALLRPQFRSGVLARRARLPDFTLTSDTGQAVSLSQYRGQVVLLYFGYTFCPDVCPATLGTLKQAFQGLGSQADDVQLLFITADPERDTLDKLHEYLNFFDPRFVGLRGTPDENRQVAGLVGAQFKREPGTEATGYLVSHLASVFAIDRQGSLALSIPLGMTAEDIAADLRLLLAE